MKDSKPGKPYKDFPLYSHRNGQWAKRVLGKIHYFGPWAKPEEALDKWIFERDYLLAGKSPPDQKEDAAGVALHALCVDFLATKMKQVSAGEMTQRSYKDYFKTCKLLQDRLGKATQVRLLSPRDFASLKETLVGRSPISIKNELQRIRSIFRWAELSRMIEPIDFGPDFKPPTKRQIRRHKQKGESQVFTPARVRALLKHANVPLRAMIYLGINCGWGNNDVATVPISAFDFKAGIADYPRPKTAIERRAILWPETIVALKAAFDCRPEPIDPEDETIFFLTVFGRRWVRHPAGASSVDSVGLSFGKLLRKLLIKKDGVNFYSLRHTFRTVADEVGDSPAIDRVMGHETPGMGTVYRGWKKDQREDERLRKVTDHVRAWLFPKKEPLIPGE